nr:MAG TPA: hypothetical protein [Caudoviricetes sp.]
MKMYLGDVPVKSLYTHTDTDEGNITAPDMQSGMIAFAKGVKLTGTGKAFAFASYGQISTNKALPVPSIINFIEVSSLTYPVKTNIALSSMKNTDFSTIQKIGAVTINGTAYDITAQVSNNMLTVGCSKDINLEAFYGRDEHV